jgi:dolichol-phosphate mannosyltransferase
MSNVLKATEVRALPQVLSLVIPFYNEAQVIPHLRQRLGELLPRIPCQTELVLVNDGSRDATITCLRQWAEADDRVVILSFSRNFGHQAAVTAGLDYATGDVAVLMDADLQDPPEIVIEMIDEYRKGFDVVYAQRTRRLGESYFKRFTAWLFYRLLQFGVNQNVPPDTGDFRLISRPCIEALKAMRETHRFIRGMVAWVGFPQTAVKFVRPPRAAGATKYPLRRMLHFAWTAAISFSPLPLRMVFAMGLVAALATVGIGIYATFSFLFHYPVVPGWTSIMFTLCLIGSFILAGLGMVGEYVAKVYEEIKQRPLYILDSVNSYNVPSDGSRPGQENFRVIAR